jgi:hypothetical protein
MAIIITIGLLLASFDRASCYDKCDLNDPLLANQLNRPVQDPTRPLPYGLVEPSYESLISLII